jgi:heparin binding hemagglutinin HbhA
MADDIFDVRTGGPTSSTWRQLQDLIGDAAGVQARWARAVVTTARAAGRGEVRSATGLLKDVGGEYQQYLRDLGKLNLRYARALQELAASSGDRFTEAVEDATRPEKLDFPDPAMPPSAAAGKPSVRKTTVKKTTSTTTKAPAKKAPAKKAPAKKAPAKKASARKTTAKAPARARRTPPARG